MTYIVMLCRNDIWPTFNYSTVSRASNEASALSNKYQLFYTLVGVRSINIVNYHQLIYADFKASKAAHQREVAQLN